MTMLDHAILKTEEGIKVRAAALVTASVPPSRGD